MAYDSVNLPVLASIPETTKTLLDLGCGCGSLAAAAKEQTGCRAVGVTSDPEECRLAVTRLDHVECADLEEYDPANLGTFDCVVCCHVLEHLRNPDRVLRLVKQCLAHDGVLIVALPNVLYWRQRLRFLVGRFRYTDGGTMDKTHLRFFDWHTAKELLESSGYVLVSRQSDGGFPLSRLLGRGHRLLDAPALWLSPGLFGWQFVFSCRPSF
jgi:SAM-dependent methyltransferase